MTKLSVDPLVVSSLLQILHLFMPHFSLVHFRLYNKTPAQAFTPPADEKKMGTIWIFVYYAVYGSGRGRCRDFLVLKWRGGGVLICKYGI